MDDVQAAIGRRHRLSPKRIEIDCRQAARVDADAAFRVLAAAVGSAMKDPGGGARREFVPVKRHAAGDAAHGLGLSV